MVIGVVFFDCIMLYKYMGCCAQGVVNVTAGMVGLPGGLAA